MKDSEDLDEQNLALVKRLWLLHFPSSGMTNSLPGQGEGAEVPRPATRALRNEKAN